MAGLDGLYGVWVKGNIMKIKTVGNLPEYKTAGAAGADIIYSGKPLIIRPQERIAVETGIIIEIPEGYEAQVRGRSSDFLRGLFCISGTIDSDYRGAINVFLFNGGRGSVSIHPGQRIAQIVISPVVRAEFVSSRRIDLSKTKRNKGKFGSTGR